MILSTIAAMAFAAEVQLAQYRDRPQRWDKPNGPVIIIKPDNGRDWSRQRQSRRPDVHVHQPKPPWWYWLLK